MLSMKSYNHFTLEKRFCLAVLLTAGKKYSEIAQELEVDVSTISREIKRNSNSSGTYNPYGANKKAKLRRKNSVRKPRIVRDSTLYKYIVAKLNQFWSPEIIAEKWNENNPDDNISFSTIYHAISHNRLDGITAQTHLRRRGKRKCGKRSRFNTIQPEHIIHDRPECANNRERIGDWEGDTIRTTPGKGCMVTLVDRKSRMLLVCKSNDCSSESIRKAVVKAFGGIQPKTLTLDNGSEFAQFKEMEKELNATVYFADPHSPWQRGTNENTNGLLRFFFSKGMDFRDISDEEIHHVVDLINNRPKLCLNLKSPAEILHLT